MNPDYIINALAILAALFLSLLFAAVMTGCASTPQEILELEARTHEALNICRYQMVHEATGVVVCEPDPTCACHNRVVNEAFHQSWVNRKGPFER